MLNMSDDIARAQENKDNRNPNSTSSSPYFYQRSKCDILLDKFYGSNNDAPYIPYKK